MRSAYSASEKEEHTCCQWRRRAMIQEDSEMTRLYLPTQTRCSRSPQTTYVSFIAKRTDFWGTHTTRKMQSKMLSCPRISICQTSRDARSFPPGSLAW